MRKFYLLALMAMVAISCHREVEIINPMPSPSEDVTAETTPLNVRTYDEALAIAEDALFNYGKLLYEQGGGHFNEAINVLNRYMALYPDSSRREQNRRSRRGRR